MLSHSPVKKQHRVCCHHYKRILRLRSSLLRLHTAYTLCSSLQCRCSRRQCRRILRRTVTQEMATRQRARFAWRTTCRRNDSAVSTARTPLVGLQTLLRCRLHSSDRSLSSPLLSGTRTDPNIRRMSRLTSDPVSYTHLTLPTILRV